MLTCKLTLQDQLSVVGDGDHDRGDNDSRASAGDNDDDDAVDDVDVEDADADDILFDADVGGDDINPANTGPGGRGLIAHRLTPAEAKARLSARRRSRCVSSVTASCAGVMPACCADNTCFFQPHRHRCRQASNPAAPPFCRRSMGPSISRRSSIIGWWSRLRGWSGCREVHRFTHCSLKSTDASLHGLTSLLLINMQCCWWG